MTQPAAKFRKKPVVIEAMSYDGTGDSAFEIRTWIREHGGICGYSGRTRRSTGTLLIVTLEGEMKVNQGDWVIRGVQGEFYPIKDSIFRETYEPADEAMS